VLHHLLPKLIPRGKHRFSHFYQSKLLIDEFGHIPFLLKVSECSRKWNLPPIVNPAAIPIMFASASNLEKRSGWFFLKSSNFNDPIKSAQSATTFRFLT
jgi:hypothetical protein